MTIPPNLSIIGDIGHLEQLWTFKGHQKAAEYARLLVTLAHHVEQQTHQQAELESGRTLVAVGEVQEGDEQPNHNEPNQQAEANNDANNDDNENIEPELPAANTQSQGYYVQIQNSQIVSAGAYNRDQIERLVPPYKRRADDEPGTSMNCPRVKRMQHTQIGWEEKREEEEEEDEDEDDEKDEEQDDEEENNDS